MSRITLSHLQKMKSQQEKIVVLTVYDSTFSQLLSKAGVDIMLVGDTLGATLQGHATTLPVTVENIIYHTQNVCRPNPHSFVLSDMPFMSYATLEKAFENTTRLMQAGGEMIKMEGGTWLTPIIEQLTERGIPVCAHLGLTPQHVHKIGHKVQGRDTEKAKEIFDAAMAHEKAGAQMLVLECVPWKLAKEITEALKIPTIGIGAGPYCDGQVLVLQDMLGITPGKPFTFVKNFMQNQPSILDAIKAYVSAVKSGEFPTLEHSFS